MHRPASITFAGNSEAVGSNSPRVTVCIVLPQCTNVLNKSRMHMEHPRQDKMESVLIFVNLSITCNSQISLPSTSRLATAHLCLMARVLIHNQPKRERERERVIYARPEKIKHAWMSQDEHMHVCAPSSLLPLVLSILHTFKPSAGLINELLQGWSKR